MDYNCQNSNYIAGTYTSNSVVTALLERDITMLALVALLISDKHICPQISYESILKWIKFWELAKQAVHHVFRKSFGLQK